MLIPFLNLVSKLSRKVSRRVTQCPRSCFAATLAVVTVLVIVWVLERSEQKRFQQQSRTDVLNQLSAVRARLEGKLNQRLFLSRGIVAYVSTINPDINQVQFESLVSVIVAQNTGIRSVALYKNTVVTHIYPLARNEAAIGFKPMTIPAEREAIERAIKTKSTVVAGPINLVPERLKVERLKVESSNLQPSNLKLSNLKPSNLQPSNLQPSTLQGYLAITVTDTGIGIPEDKLDRIRDSNPLSSYSM